VFEGFFYLVFVRLLVEFSGCKVVGWSLVKSCEELLVGMKFAIVSLTVVSLILLTGVFLAFFLPGCVTRQQTRQATLVASLTPPNASLRPHVSTPSPYLTVLPSITPTPFLECEKDSDCIVSGCNGEVCARRKYFTPCVFKPEFECLKLTTCSCNNGVCSWKQNDAFKQCLKTKAS